MIRLSIFRKQTPKGEKRAPNPEPAQEYTRTVNVARLTRAQKRALGYLPTGAQLPGEQHRRYRNGSEG